MFVRLRGNELTITRIKKGLSIRSLARKAGISHCFLSQIENRQRYPSAKTAAKLCQALEVDFEEVFEIVDDRAALAS